MTMAIFMTVREEYEDGLWRGKDVVACLPESVSFCFTFLLQAKCGAVIDVLAGDMYRAIGNCCIYASNDFFLYVMTTACMHGMSLLRFSTALKMCR